MKNATNYKMTNTYYDRIFRDYLEFYGSTSDVIVKWEPRGKHDIVVYHADGSKAFYDHVSGTVYNVHKRTDCKEFIDDDIFTKRFQWKLNTALNASGLSRDEICQRTGISRAALSSYTNGHRMPGSLYLYKLAKVLKFPVEELLSVDEWDL